MALAHSLTTMGLGLPPQSGNSPPFTHIGGERVNNVLFGAAMGIDMVRKVPKVKYK